MTPVILSKGIYQKCTAEEIVYLEKNIREMVDEMEGKKTYLHVPFPCTKEERAKYGDEKVEVTFFPINPHKYDRMVMIIPVYDKKRGCNVWHVQMKDEFGRIELDIQTPVLEGHHRTKRAKC